MSNMATAVANNIAQTGRSEGFATILTIVPPILGVILIISSIAMSYYGYKAKHLFV